MHFTTTARSRRHTRGFTLIELLTVIAIIGILAAILIPTVGAVRNKAKTTKCASQFRAWNQAIQLFASDNKGSIAFTLSVGSADNSVGAGKLYSPYFNILRMENMGTTAASLDPMDYFFSCPAVDRNGTETSDSRRMYAFVAPIGHKTVGSAGIMFGRTQVNGLKYMNISQAQTPSRLFLMMEQKPDSTGVIDGASFGSQITSKTKDILVGTDPSLIRHGGVVNVLFLDGHVKTMKWADLDVNSLPPAERGSFAQHYTL